MSRAGRRAGTGGETEATTATFDFVANASEVAYECSLDLGP